VSDLAPATDAFPRRYARTQRFSLGSPRDLAVSPDGTRVVFLRAAAGDDPATGLWVLDVATGREVQVGDPAALDHGRRVTDEERLRRERAREGASGITSYATDRAVRTAAFTVGGRLYSADLDTATLTPIPLPDVVADPRPSPDGVRLAFATAGGVSIVDTDGAVAVRVAGAGDEDDPDVTWGLPEFVAAEEMDRTRGFWWSPDGRTLAITRVDTSPVPRWHIASPVDPDVAPVAIAYPAAGAPNADVTLHLVPLFGGSRVEVRWDRGYFPYLADVVWGEHGPLTIVVQSRDQKVLRTLTVDPETGRADVAAEEHDLHWVALVPGTPRWTAEGRLLRTANLDDTRTLLVGDRALTPPGLQVRAVLGVTPTAVLVSASEEPTAIVVWRVPLDGSDPQRLSTPDGVAGAVAGGDTVVVAQRGLDHPGAVVTVHAREAVWTIASRAEEPPLALRMAIRSVGPRALRTALLLPSWWRDGGAALPVLVDPYGGPGAQRVLAGQDAHLVSQWFAEQGFAVLVADGRGTPGRGPAWERAVAGDLAGPVLEDQIDALHATAADNPALDLRRVAIRGWSFGGYLAALGVLRAPDVFHAAIAGAPVTDWRLYDTHYTERYLGLPQEDPGAYDRSAVRVPPADAPARPMLLLHGLADDNVVAAHTLRLSRALLEAGRPHQVLPLSGVTHMTPQTTVAENLLHLQLAFLRHALGLHRDR